MEKQSISLYHQSFAGANYYTAPRTWHPHIYEKTPKEPTPHFITDILGLSREEDNRHCYRYCEQRDSWFNREHHDIDRSDIRCTSAESSSPNISGSSSHRHLQRRKDSNAIRSPDHRKQRSDSESSNGKHSFHVILIVN